MDEPHRPIEKAKRMKLIPYLQLYMVNVWVELKK